jgi:hypothetical protein
MKGHSMIHYKRRAIVVVIALSLMAQACGSNVIRSFRVALAASSPLVNSLVASGAITSTQTTKIIADFDDGAACADTLQSAFAAIAKDDPDAKAKKLTASVNALRCFRVIIDRQNFAANPRIQNAANIAEGILASLVVFYSEPGPMRASAQATRRAVTASDEKQLEQKLKAQVDELKAAMKP